MLGVPAKLRVIGEQGCRSPSKGLHMLWACRVGLPSSELLVSRAVSSDIVE